MLPEFTREELAAGLDKVAMEILAQANVEAPPVDAFDVARRLGITIALDDQQGGRARYVRLNGRQRGASCQLAECGAGCQPAKTGGESGSRKGKARTRSKAGKLETHSTSGRLATCPTARPTILLRPEVREERRHWAVAHEIGEHVAYRVFAVWGVDPGAAGPGVREEVANQLAGRLLLPTVWFRGDGRRLDWDLFAIKTLYATASHELIARRMLECGPPVIVSIFDHGSLHFRRSNLPGRVPPLSPAERECCRTVHEDNREHEVYEGLRWVRGWPIHEDGWKREILRTEVEDGPVDV